MSDWGDPSWLPISSNLAVTVEMLVRLCLAVVAGAGLGWERTEKEKPAGLRTHMLVSLGAAIAMVATLQTAGPQWTHGGPLQVEASRVIAGIVGGIGFLGAGTIIKGASSVQGITTAANIWVAATLGIACGLGQYTLAIAGVVLTLIILRAMNWIEWWLFPSSRPPGLIEMPGEKSHETSAAEGARAAGSPGDRG